MHCTPDLFLLVLYLVSSIVFCAFYFIFYSLQLLVTLFFENLHVCLIYAIKHLLTYLRTYIHTYLLTYGVLDLENPSLFRKKVKIVTDLRPIVKIKIHY